MTPNELQTLRFFGDSLLWGAVAFVGVVGPWVTWAWALGVKGRGR
jgi:hypothetical protein